MGIVKYIFFFGFLLLMSFHSEQEYETIAWNANRHLAWSDFKGKAPLNARAAATTASGITYKFSTSGTRETIEVDFEIDTFFYPNKSWYQPDLCDEVILSHEQLHFDISELFARKMRKRLAETTFTHSTIKAKVKSIYKKIIKELSEFQNRYDQETNYSRDRDQQLLWNKKIGAALEQENPILD